MMIPKSRVGFAKTKNRYYLESEEWGALTWKQKRKKGGAGRDDQPLRICTIRLHQLVKCPL